MPQHLSTLTLNLSVDETDDREGIDLARKLRQELSLLSEIESIEPPPLLPDPRHKGAPIDWQTVVVSLAASGGVLTTLIGTVQAWLTRHERSSITLEIGGDKLIITGSS